MIDVEGQLRIQIPQRIVGQRRQVNHRVKSFEVGCLHVAKIVDDLWNRHRLGPEGARPVQMRVQSDHFVARFQKHWDQNRPDISSMPCYQYFHEVPFLRICFVYELTLWNKPDR